MDESKRINKYDSILGVIFTGTKYTTTVDIGLIGFNAAKYCKDIIIWMTQKEFRNKILH